MLGGINVDAKDTHMTALLGNEWARKKQEQILLMCLLIHR